MPEPNEEAARHEEAAPVAEATTTTNATPEPCGSPPPAERAATAAPDPRGELLRMAQQLMRSRDARLLADYLRLRRAAARSL